MISTVAGEAALRALYRLALNRWVASGDPWESIVDTVVADGFALLFAHTVTETLIELDLPAQPQAPDGLTAAIDATVDAAVTEALCEALGCTEAELAAATDVIDANPGLVARRDQVVDAARAGTVTITADVKVGELDELARQQSYQAAGVMNSAVIAAADTSEQTLQKCWISTMDARCRDTHFAADGQRVPMDGTFTVGAAQLKFPGDPDGPPEEVINCRCRVGILAVDEALPDEKDRHTERLDGRDSTAKNREGSQRDEINRRADEGVIRARDDPEGTGRTAAGASTPVFMVGDSFRTFTDAVIAVLGEPTSDYRVLAHDIDLSFRRMPLPLMWCRQSSEGHDESFTVGVLESARVEDDRVLASGYLLNTPEADEAAVQISHGVTGPSVDLAAAQWFLTDERGREISEEELWEMPEGAIVYQTFTVAELIGTTLVATPAFGTTSITLNSQRESRDAAVVAAAGGEFTPRIYDHRLFEDPHLREPTAPTLEGGRFFGHLACFGSCHRSVQSACVLAPHSPSSYSHFHTSPSLRLDNGVRLPVGRLTVGTGHAGDQLSAGAAIAHYDNTGTCFALVRVGEDEHGIWFSGVPSPWASAEQVEAGVCSPLSGDWRDFGQGLDLVAALAVNTPGFVARGRDDRAGRPVALVASMGPRRAREPVTMEAIKAAMRECLAELGTVRAESVSIEELLDRAETTVPPDDFADSPVAALLQD